MRRFPLAAVLLAVVFYQRGIAAPVQWTYVGGSSRATSAIAIASDQQGNVITAGYLTNNPDAGNPDHHFYVVKNAAADGHLLWQYTSAFSGTFVYLQAVQIDSANDVVIAGRDESRFHIVKLAGSDGHVLWEAPPSDAFNESAFAAMKLDRNNDVIVAGTLQPVTPANTDTSDYIYVAKCSGSTGSVLWQTRHDLPSYASALAIDSAGNAVVGGLIRRLVDNSYYTGDFYVAEYGAADGQLKWERRRPDDSPGVAEVVATDAQGNALAYGTLGVDQYSEKLAADDGAPLWTQRLPNTARRALHDLAVDANGDAIVAGYDASGNDPWSIYVAKYGGSDGGVVWEHRTSETTDYQAGEANRLQLAADGSVYVCGYLSFTSAPRQTYTAAYGNTDGATLWQQRYRHDELESTDPAPDPLTLLRDGNIALLMRANSVVTLKYSTASQLLNISTRADVSSGDNATIAGFIVAGDAPKRLLIRAIGPSLPIDGALQDPLLELHEANGQVTFNDNWKDTQESEIIATGIPPQNENESAIVATVMPGAHTAVVRSKNGSSGIALVEVYDIDDAAPSTAANISTRGRVDVGDNALIAGLILRGPRPSTMLVRAIGPSLASDGVKDALQDPILELVDSNGNSLVNDNWKLDRSGTPDATQQSRIDKTGAAPKDDRESALLLTLSPATYTAIIRGKNDTSGVALVEAYNLE